MRVDLEASDIDKKLKSCSRIVRRTKRCMGDVIVFKALNELYLQHLRNGVGPLRVREIWKLFIRRKHEPLRVEQKDRRRCWHHKLLFERLFWRSKVSRNAEVVDCLWGSRLTTSGHLGESSH